MEKKVVRPKYSDGDYIPGLGWETDLTKENCTPELWEQLGGDGPDLTEKDYQNFLDGKPFDTPTKSK